MNIFVLSETPSESAQYLCDLHVNKMLLESVQLLCTFLNEQGFETPYKSTHKHHPCQLWLKESNLNVVWLELHAMALCSEYSYRFNKRHKCQDVLEKIAHYLHLLSLDKKITNFIQVMPNEFRQEDAIEAYRAYYINKQHTMKRPMKWTKREVPKWFVLKY